MPSPLLPPLWHRPPFLPPTPVSSSPFFGTAPPSPALAPPFWHRPPSPSEARPRSPDSPAPMPFPSLAQCQEGKETVLGEGVPGSESGEETETKGRGVERAVPRRKGKEMEAEGRDRGGAKEGEGEEGGRRCRGKEVGRRRESQE